MCQFDWNDDLATPLTTLDRVASNRGNGSVSVANERGANACPESGRVKGELIWTNTVTRTA